LLTIFYRKRVKKKLNIKYLVGGIVAVCIVIMLLNSSTVSHKFSNDNVSFIIRFNDIISGFKLILDKPFIGYGYASPTLSSVLISKGITANSVGLFIVAQYFGVLVAILFFYLIIRHIKKMLGVTDIIESLCIVIMFFLIFMTEPFMTKEFFVLFMFAMNQSNLLMKQQ
ncbi:hypothetical protein IHQ11_12575, partial [Priestia megaterium]|uniref:hypothetical protein n=1 Tax=Priestia megaterium TaxID=1404 RepID=UPI001B39EC98